MTLPGWPRYLSREQAAAYVGVSVTTFDQEVANGCWPQPRRRGAKGTRATWDRELLDAAADRVSALNIPAVPSAAAASRPLIEDVSLQRVIDAARRGTFSTRGSAKKAVRT